MGKGRPRTPTNVLEMRGAFIHNPNRRDERAGEPKDDRPLGDPPEYFNVDQIRAWNELADRGRSWLGYPDGMLLELAALQLAALRMLAALVPTSVLKAGGTDLANTLTKLGFPPSERSKIDTRGKKAESKFSGIGQRPA